MKSKYTYSVIIFLFTCISQLSAHHGEFHFGPGQSQPHVEGEEIHEEDDHFHFGPGL